MKSINRLLLIGLIPTVIVLSNCASRKIRATVSNDPYYTSSKSAQLSGNTFALKIFQNNELKGAEILSTKIAYEFQTALEKKGFKQVEDAKSAHILIVVAAHRRDQTVNVPARFSFGGWLHGGNGGASGAYVGAHEASVRSERIEMQVVDCKAAEKPKVVSQGTAYPKAWGDRFLSDDDRISLGIDKLLEGSIFDKISSAPTPRETASSIGCSDEK